MPTVGPLLPLGEFKPIIDALRGKRALVLPCYRNVSQKMAAVGMGSVMRQARCEAINNWRVGECPEDISAADLAIVGSADPDEQHWFVNHCDSHSLPVVFMPQAFSRWMGKDRIAFARDRESQALCPDSILAPDLALGMSVTVPWMPQPQFAKGIFLRRDREKEMGKRMFWSLGDPMDFCTSPEEYVVLAAKYEWVLTDRPHFAMAALLAGRKTTLMPGTSRKNKNLFDTWLEPLGCDWWQNKPFV